MQILKLKIPPPVVALLMAALMWLVARAAPTFAFVLPARQILAGWVALAGIATSIVGVASFRRGGKNVNPLRPGKGALLVTSGLFKLTAHPIDLGLLLVLVSWAVFLSKGLAVIFLL